MEPPCGMDVCEMDSEHVGNEHIQRFMNDNMSILKEFRDKHVKYLETLGPNLQNLLLIWALDSTPFNAFNYEEYNSLDAKVNLITTQGDKIRSNWPLLSELFVSLEREFTVEWQGLYGTFAGQLRDYYPGGDDGKYDIVAKFMCVRNWFNNIILDCHASTKRNFYIHVFRLSKTSGELYEFPDPPSPANKFISYTMFPFGSKDPLHQDIVSVNHYSDPLCCFTIAHLGPTTPCMYIPKRYGVHLVDEIVVPLETQQRHLMRHEMRPYSYKPIANQLELVNLRGSNFREEILTSEGPWKSLKDDGGNPINTLWILDRPIEIQMNTFEYDLVYEEHGGKMVGQGYGTKPYRRKNSTKTKRVKRKTKRVKRKTKRVKRKTKRVKI
jgi:hypothetical protein